MKKTRTARRLDRKIVLYAPDSFDPEVHLPEPLRHLADYARYLLHRVVVGRVHQRRGNNLVPLKHDYLVKFIPEAHYLAIRDALIESGVIHVRKFCIPGQVAYGFRLLHPHDQGFSAHQPTTERLIRKIREWRKQESRDVRLPLHRDLRRHIKALTIDEGAALASVRGNPFQRSAQAMMIRRIADRDFFTIADRFGRFHSNLTNLKSSLRPHLRYHDSPLVNLDIANSQPMIFCLLLANLLSGDGKLKNLLEVEFPETSNPYHVEMDGAFLSSLFPCSPGDHPVEVDETIMSSPIPSFPVDNQVETNKGLLSSLSSSFSVDDQVELDEIIFSSNSILSFFIKNEKKREEYGETRRHFLYYRRSRKKNATLPYQATRYAETNLPTPVMRRSRTTWPSSSACASGASCTTS